MDFLFPPVQGIHCICRECGALCDPQACAERGGLCARCAFPRRVTVKTYTFVPEPDPIRDAIDRAAASWAAANPENR